jgi:hypothetical protein
LGRAGQWSLRLPCAAPGRHASWGRLSSEGLGLALGQASKPPNACGLSAWPRLKYAGDAKRSEATRSVLLPRSRCTPVSQVPLDSGSVQAPPASGSWSRVCAGNEPTARMAQRLKYASGIRVRGLTFELRRPARRGALAPRRTMERATALRGARAPRLVGSPLERGVRRHFRSR